MIVNPNRAEAAKERTKKHWPDYQQKGEQWNQTMREHRRYKQSLYLSGELKLRGD